jgi:hypothetical protein
VDNLCVKGKSPFPVLHLNAEVQITIRTGKALDKELQSLRQAVHNVDKTVI